MLFNSPIFIFVYLPIVWIGFFVLQTRGWRQLTTIWLAVASLVFYAYWDPTLGAPLIVGSIMVNYFAGLALDRMPDTDVARRRILLWLGLAGNLGLLGYFKYTNFLVDNVSVLLGSAIDAARIILPIGISFFTFQQIAFLVDSYRREVVERDLARYTLFVTFFPHLIAGPLVHHAEMMPQFGRQKTGQSMSNLAIGLTIFTIGLAKKVLIADTAAAGSSPLFDAVAAGHAPSLAEAWAATLCYTIQIYFDFSGYSDMAIGLGNMFGIRLPINFASPYKSRSIIEFWRRWHITLSRFLRVYLYAALLGGNRRGPARRYVNVFLTMLLGGIWHGAGWTFVLWGTLHGAFIVINQLWRAGPGTRVTLPAAIAWPLTLLCVMVAWVPFRAADMPSTVAIYHGMLGLNGVSGSGAVMGPGSSYAVAALSLLLALLLPNTQQWMYRTRPALPTRGYPETEFGPPARWLPAWQPNVPAAALAATFFAICVLKLNDFSEFIYFQF